ncbi:hypothetical protein C8R47DRAFT_1281760 [Mycena vitilis]|nr:hypothetical protein C8R47DRAFT_1281760 [Mycena vitilis]
MRSTGYYHAISVNAAGGSKPWESQSQHGYNVVVRHAPTSEEIEVEIELNVLLGFISIWQLRSKRGLEAEYKSDLARVLCVTRRISMERGDEVLEVGWKEAPGGRLVALERICDHCIFQWFSRCTRSGAQVWIVDLGPEELYKSTEEHRQKWACYEGLKGRGSMFRYRESGNEMGHCGAMILQADRGNERAVAKETGIGSVEMKGGRPGGAGAYLRSAEYKISKRESPVSVGNASELIMLVLSKACCLVVKFRTAENQIYLLEKSRYEQGRKEREKGCVGVGHAGEFITMVLLPGWEVQNEKSWKGAAISRGREEGSEALGARLHMVTVIPPEWSPVRFGAEPSAMWYIFFRLQEDEEEAGVKERPCGCE